jgi:hypothetical protein
MTITVVRRSRLGNNSEDITSFTQNNVAIVDGYEVLSIPSSFPVSPKVTAQDQTSPKPVADAEHGNQPIAGEFRPPVKKLFDLRRLDIRSGPRGIAYLASSKEFVFNDPLLPLKLFVTNQSGQPVRTLDLSYPGGYTPVHVEGLAYVPHNSPQFPDHVVMVTYGPSLRLEVIRPSDGQIVAEIIPQAPLGSKNLTGICYAGHDHLFVSTDDDNQLGALDFSGRVIEPRGYPSPLPLSSQGIEGLTLTLDARLAAINAFAGMLALIGLGSRPPQTVNYQIGFGLTTPAGLSWDTTRNRHLVHSFVRGTTDGRFISTVSPSLDSARQILKVDFDGRQVAYLPDEKLIALTRSTSTPTIRLFNENGQLAEEVGFDPAFIRVFAITYLPKAQEFIVSTQQRLSTLFVLSRKGALRRTIDLSSTGIARASSVAFLPMRLPGQLLITDRDSTRGVFIGLEGQKLGEFDFKRDLQVLRPGEVSAITTGDDAGAIAVVDTDNSELVVFRTS